MAMTFPELDAAWSAFILRGQTQYPIGAITTLVTTDENGVTKYGVGSIPTKKSPGVYSGTFYNLYSNKGTHNQLYFFQDVNGPGLGWTIDFYDIKAGSGPGEIEILFTGSSRMPTIPFRNRPYKLTLQNEAKMYFGWEPPSKLNVLRNSGIARPALIFSIQKIIGPPPNV